MLQPTPENSLDYPSDVAPIGLSENSPGDPPAGPEGLIGYWNFDEGQGDITHDGSGLGNDGTVYGADWVDWKMGAALEFNGGDYVLVAPDPSLSPTQITVAGWIYPTLFPGVGEANDHFLGKWGSEGYQYIAYLAAGGDGEIRFQIVGGTDLTNASHSNVNVPPNDWSHFAATWDGSDIKIYINGVENTTAIHKQFTGDIRSGNSPLKIGLGNGSGFRGRMDGIRMYNRALAPDEILVLYQEGDAAPTALTVSPSSFSSSWNESTTLTATLTSGGSPLVGKKIAWSAVVGNVAPSSATTDASGQVTVTYTTPSISTRNPVAVTAFFLGDSSHRSSIASSYVTLPSLVGYWKFDEGSGNTAYDSSGNGYDGTIYGATWDYCKIGKSLGFSADDYVRISNSPSLNPQNAITVEAWFRASDVSSEPLVSKHNDATGNNSYHVGIANGSFGFLFDDDGSGWATGDQRIVPVANDQWYHGAVTWNGTTWKIYLNGDEKATGTWTGTIYAGAADLYLGTREQLGDFYDGIMDEVRIYNRALGPEEVVQNYQGQQVVENGLVSWWSFDDGTASDTRGTNHGTIHGAMVLDPAGRIGKALWFDGVDDTVSMDNVLNFDRTDNWTIAAWIKTSDSGHGAVVAKIMAGQRGYDFFVVGYTHPPDEPYFGRLAVHINAGGAEPSIRKYSDIKVDDGEWHHIAYTYDGSFSAEGVNIYVDGVLHNDNATHVFVTDTIQNDYPLRIGSRENVDYFRGLIDEVMIHNRALSPEEIAALVGPKSATSLSVSPSSFTIQSRENQTLTATLKDNNDNALANKIISWSATAGTLSATSGATDSAGQATVTYTAPKVTAHTSVTITASFAGEVNYNSSSGSSTGTVLSELVGYWKFDENSGNVAFDNSDYSNDGAIYGALWDNGVSGTALKFNGGEEYVEVAPDPSFDFDELTWTAWVKINDTTDLHGIIGRANELDYAGEWFVAVTSESQIQFATRADNGRVNLVENTPLSTGTWHYIAGTYDGSTMKIYVDGVPGGSAEQSGPLSYVDMPLYIGWGDETLSFDGIIDEVRIYNRALNEEEIKGEGPSSFTLGLSENEVTLVDGQASLTVTLSPEEGPSGIVYLGIEGLPSGMEWNFSQNPIFLTGDTPTTVMLSLNGTPPQAESTLTVVARGYGEQPREERASFTLNVTEATIGQGLYLGKYSNASDSTSLWELRGALGTYGERWEKIIEIMAPLDAEDALVDRLNAGMNYISSSIPELMDNLVSEYVQSRGGGLPSETRLTDGLRAYLHANLSLILGQAWYDVNDFDELAQMLREIYIELMGVVVSIGPIEAAEGIIIHVFEPTSFSALMAMAAGDQGASYLAGEALDALTPKFEAGTFYAWNYITLRRSVKDFVCERDSDDTPAFGVKDLTRNYARDCLSAGTYAKGERSLEDQISWVMGWEDLRDEVDQVQQRWLDAYQHWADESDYQGNYGEAVRNRYDAIADYYDEEHW